MPLVTEENFSNAIDIYYLNTSGDDPLMGAFLESYWKRTTYGILLNEKGVERIRMLLSPHAKTIIKAWLIHREGEKDVQTGMPCGGQTPRQGSY
jgi:hypothetical protein